jgi:hypothetical protein
VAPVTSLQGLNTELVYFGILKKSIEKKGDACNIEKYVEKKLHIKIKNKWKKVSVWIITFRA